MAHYKLNVLHLHLTDDQGWRLHVRSRPLLTRLSSSTSVDGDPGGFYSAEDYADIVAFGAVRGVRVVPEIDVPGHVNAATHAYGDLTPSGEPTDAYTGHRGRLQPAARRPARDRRRSCADVFADVAAMTPGEYVHIGGDEVLTMEADEYATLVAAAVRRGPGGRQEGGRLAGDRAHAAGAGHRRAVLGHPRGPGAVRRRGRRPARCCSCRRGRRPTST